MESKPSAVAMPAVPPELPSEDVEKVDPCGQATHKANADRNILSVGHHMSLDFVWILFGGH